MKEMERYYIEGAIQLLRKALSHTDEHEEQYQILQRRKEKLYQDLRQAEDDFGKETGAMNNLVHDLKTAMAKLNEPAEEPRKVGRPKGIKNKQNKRDKAYFAERNQEIERLLSKGWKQPKIARKFNITSGRVWQIKNKMLREQQAEVA